MSNKVSVVIPTYKEKYNVEKLIDNIYNSLSYHKSHIIFNIIDDSPDNSIKELIEHTPIYYHKGNGNYGNSLVTGIMRAGFHGEFDKLIIMDIDHPFNDIFNMIGMLDKYDMVIGCDLNENKERNVTKIILKELFNIDVPHPTCGFMGFTSEVIGYGISSEKTISWFLAKSKKDIVHVEFLYMGIKKKLNIGILYFNTKDSDIKHNYSMKRNLVWLKDVAKMFLYDKLLNWYQ